MATIANDETLASEPKVPRAATKAAAVLTGAPETPPPPAAQPAPAKPAKTPWVPPPARSRSRSPPRARVAAATDRARAAAPRAVDFAAGAARPRRRRHVAPDRGGVAQAARGHRGDARAAARGAVPRNAGAALCCFVRRPF